MLPILPMYGYYTLKGYRIDRDRCLRFRTKLGRNADRYLDMFRMPTPFFRDGLP